ncbi:hypothetical protein QE152_g35957 [Popillia japonica]|uniref:Uncharacterized protein n=1 Tax=Popillia japonica TaxID=7064 RepID=A0AAW1IDU9_POPJA
MTPAKVIDASKSPRAYDVMLPNGNIVTRNRFNIYKASPQDFELSKPDLDTLPNGVRNNKDDVLNADLTSNLQKNVPRDVSTLNAQKELVNQYGLDLDRKVVSKSGRTIKKPKYLSDYITDF